MPYQSIVCCSALPVVLCSLWPLSIRDETLQLSSLTQQLGIYSDRRARGTGRMRIDIAQLF